MTPIIPSLSPMGWISDPKTALNIMFAHSLVSDYSQSTNYAKNITSIAWIVATYQNNKTEMLSAMENSLQIYLGRFFDAVSVVAVDDGTDKPSYVINLDIVAQKGGIAYQLTQNLNIDSGKLNIVLAHLNQ